MSLWWGRAARLLVSAGQPEETAKARLDGVLADAYRTFARRAASDRADGSKQDRVRDHVLSRAPNPFRMADIRTALPGISDQTIRVVLDRLRREELIFAEGLGRSAAWRRTP